MIQIQVEKHLSDFCLQVDTAFGKGITVLAGSSGSGKSTLLKMIAGFVNPDKGSLKIADRYLFHRQKRINLYPERRRIGFVPQNYILFPHLNVFENVAFSLRIQKVSGKELNQKVEEVLDLCSISHLIERFPKDLSGGEQQRVALARAIVTNPEILLLDEPFSALDVSTRRYIRTEVREILDTANIPSIMVTHDPTDAVAFGNEIHVMEKGTLIQSGCFQDLRKSPRSRFVAEFTGLNAYYGEANQSQRGMINVSLRDGGQVIAVGNKHGKVLVMIDPTDITISRDFPTISACNCYSVKVSEMIEDYSGQYRLILRGEMDLVAHISSDSLRRLRIVTGDQLYASVKATAVRIEAV